MPLQWSADTPSADGIQAPNLEAVSITLANPVPAPPARRRKGRFLLPLVVVLASLVVVGGVAGVVVYARATAIDRSTPVISS